MCPGARPQTRASRNFDLAIGAVVSTLLDPSDYFNAWYKKDGPQNYGFYLGEPSQVTLYHNEVRAGWLIEPRSGLMLEASWTLRVRTPEQGEGLATNYLRVGLSANLRDRHPFQDARYALPE